MLDSGQSPGIESEMTLGGSQPMGMVQGVFNHFPSPVHFPTFPEGGKVAWFWHKWGEGRVARSSCKKCPKIMLQAIF